MKKQWFKLATAAMLTASTLALSVPAATQAKSDKIFYENKEVRRAQIGTLTVKEDTKLHVKYKNELLPLRSLSAGDTYRVYGETRTHYLVGSIYYVEKAKVSFKALPQDVIQQAGAKYGYSHKAINLTVFHTNDTHANVERIPARVTALNEQRKTAENSIYLDAGDVFSGTLYYNKFKGLADAELINLLGVDAMTIGNHEFDDGPSVYANYLKAIKFPVVSSNVDVTGDEALSPLFNKGVSNLGQDGKINEYIVLNVDGERVGVFGLTTEDTAFLASPGKTIKFEDRVAEAKKAVETFQANGINKVIALTHLGHLDDIELAKQVKGIDVIVGGHSHTEVKAPYVVSGDEPTVIVQANEYGKYLGRLDVSFDEAGKVTKQDGKLILVNDGKAYFAEDAAAKEIVAKYAKDIEGLKKEVVGSAKVKLDGERASVRTKEALLGNLYTDAMVAKANQLGAKVEIAVTNGGGIRASIDAGNVTMGQVLTAFPFGNVLTKVDVTGEELLAALENGVSAVEKAEGRFLQVSGIKFSYNVSKPAGQRVVKAEALSGGKYETIDPKKTYAIVTNGYVAKGGDNFNSFKAAYEAKRFLELSVTDSQVVLDYLKANKDVEPKIEGRITEVK